MKTKNELSIFKTPSIKVLKSLYYKSKSYLLEKNLFEDETNCIMKVSRHITQSPIVKKSLDKLENELRIFKTPNIETLKSSYHESISIV